MKKSFKADNPALAFISKPNTQSAHDTQHTQEVHGTQQVQHTQGTQGKRGQKHPRINMAFPADHLDYLQTISRLDGCSITEYVNRLVDADQNKRAAEVDQFKALAKGAK